MSTGSTTLSTGVAISMASLERYCAGTALPDERVRVEAWFMAHPETIGWERLPAAEIARRAREIVQRERERARPLSPRFAAWHARPRWSMWPVFGVVAAAGLVVAAWVLGGSRVGKGVGSSPAAYTTYVTANGQRATIMLADGNTVVLNVASRLEVPTNYGAGNHLVRLPVGEALFTVSHRTGVPFAVVTGGTRARVLGTSFVVRHYLTDTVTTVAVSDGKVAVGPAVVTARQLVEVGRGGVSRVRAADPAQFAFAAGVLTIRSMPLARAVPELDRWYAAEIRLGGSSFAQVPIKGNFTAGSLSDLSSILELMLNARVVRDGRVLTLYPKADK